MSTTPTLTSCPPDPIRSFEGGHQSPPGLPCVSRGRRSQQEIGGTKLTPGWTSVPTLSLLEFPERTSHPGVS